tara:strand:+ start:154 stop:552 length:399 start_codon:yes stop_codon:yes gene_type:complete
METKAERDARLARMKAAFGSGSHQTYTTMYDIEADAKEWTTGLHWAMDEELKTGKTYSASDMERKWHVEPKFITLKKYLKKSPGKNLGKEVYRSAYNQGVRIENKNGEKAYPKAWLEMFFGNLDELANFLKD